jgi:hypothetical protein
MPDGNGPVPVIWARDGAGDSFTVQLHGFVARAYGPIASGLPLPLAGAAWPLFLANGESTLVEIDARLLTATPFARSLHAAAGCALGPGPTFDGQSYLLMPNTAPACGWLQVWQLGALPGVVDSLPASGSAIVAARLSVNVHAYHERQNELLHVVGPSSPPFAEHADQVYGFRLSPRGDRAIPLGDQWVTGVPVIDSHTGAFAYRLPAVRATYGAAFSAGGDTAFVTDGYRTGVLVADATTGDSLAWVRLDTVTSARTAWDLALEPSGRWIFVELESGVAVIDRENLDLAAVVRWPAGQGCTGWSTFLFSATQPSLYLAMTGATYWDPTARACVLSFSTIPPP